jgi:hypothetical protein
MSKYAHVDARLFCCDTLPQHMLGVNPKINNMLPAYLAAKYSLVLVSDAGILSELFVQVDACTHLTVGSDTLDDMVDSMTDNVAIVTQMPFTYDSQQRRNCFAATLEKVCGQGVSARIYTRRPGVLRHNARAHVSRCRHVEHCVFNWYVYRLVYKSYIRLQACRHLSAKALWTPSAACKRLAST